jgi:hypothetical protein
MIRPERIRERLRVALLLSTGLAAGPMHAVQTAAQEIKPTEPVQPASAPDSPPIPELDRLSELPVVNLADVGVTVPFGFIVVRRADAIAASLEPMQGNTTCPERILLPYQQERHEEQYSRGYPAESELLSQQRGEAVCVFYVDIVPITLFLGRALMHEQRSVRARPVQAPTWSRQS